MASTYGYDMAGQMTDITHKNGGTVLARSAYALDILGRRAAQTREDGITETYGYDATSQLTSADYGANSRVTVDPTGGRVTRETFAYDALGNRTQVGRVVPNAPSTTTAYTANALNQYTQVAGTAFAYDANGNLINDGKQAYRYDAQNRLLAVEPVAAANGSVRADFAYDARNRAVARMYYTFNKAGVWVLNPDDSRALTYDVAWNPLAERTLNGAQLGEYIHGQRTDEVLVSNLKSQFVYPVADGLGSVVALTDDKGKVTERFRYSAYGQPTSLSANYQAGASSVFGYRFLFTGREWLSANGLNEHRNRAYSPTIARWLSSDPLGFDAKDVNLYRYCFDLPCSLRDSFGLKVFVCRRDVQTGTIWDKLLKVLGPAGQHYFIKTDTIVAGLGPANNGPLPACPIGTPTAIVDHSADVAGAECEEAVGVSDNCINAHLDIGRSQGAWSTANNCVSFVGQVLSLCPPTI